MKKILVPCDFSNSAIQAFQFACEVASLAKAEICVLHVIELPVVHSSLLVPVKAYESTFLKELQEKVNRNFEKMKEKWGKKLKISISVELGPVAASIVKYIAKKNIDTVVIGTHGSSGFREFAIGSNTEKVIRSSKVPVFAIKQNRKISTVRDIIFPTTFDLSKRSVASVKELQSFFKAKLHILHINTLSNFHRDIVTEKQMKEFATANQFKNYTLNIYNGYDEESGVADFSSKFKNKIMAMPTHGRKGLSHLIKGSLTEDLVNHIDCPVWTCVR